MLFYSIGFLAFFVVVFVLYWFVFKQNQHTQNLVLLVASLSFYGWINWRFLILILLHAAYNFYLGKKIFSEEKENRKKIFLWVGVVLNVGILCYFKYFNFFYESFIDAARIFSINASYNSLHIILPLGISFFTFQSLGYLIDIYNEEIEPSKNPLEFSLYVSFFPKILAGPIERAQGFIKQVAVKRTFDYTLAVNGLKQILWGLFIKIVIADNIAVFVNQIFGNTEAYTGITLVLGAFLYTVQVYCDFSGYSEIAIGFSKLLGIRLMRNFAFPYFSVNMSDYWKKWHISLSSWMMDYVFTPLSFVLRKYKKTGLAFSIVITFVIVGLWHDGRWTYILFGLLHGIYFIPMVFKGKNSSSPIVAKGKLFPSLSDFLKMCAVFTIVMLTTVIFRANNLKHAFLFYKNMLLGITSKSSYVQTLNLMVWEIGIFIPILIIFLFSIEWFSREKEHALDGFVNKWPRALRWTFYLVLIFMVLVQGQQEEQQFIYFQF